MKTFTEYTELLNNTFTKKDVIAPVESSSEASRAYAVGEKFFYNNILYEATDVIASGGIIDPGTNCEEAEDIVSQIENKTIVTDAVPTQGSTNPVQSGGVYDALSNRNLLDNPWFTINSRGQSVYSSNNNSPVYINDRWVGIQLNYKYITQKANGGIAVDYSPATSQVSWFVCEQLLSEDISKKLCGKTVTFSVLTSNWVNMSSVQLRVYDDASFTTHNNRLDDGSLIIRTEGDGLVQGQVSIPSTLSSGQIKVCINATTNATDVATSKLDIDCVKLELGSVSTLAMDTIPDYALELTKCRASTADSSDIYANQGEINVGTSNPNLLDNPWFTVNQRGETSYYFADRWLRFASGLTFTNNDGVTISGTLSSLENLGVQKIEWDRLKDNIGKAITLSVLIDGTIYKAVGKIETPTSSWKSHVSLEIPSLNIWFQLLTYGTSPSAIELYIKNINTDPIDVTIRAVKLELGSVSTLAMDTAPNYAEELLKCRRYFQRFIFSAGMPIGTGYCSGTNTARIVIPLLTSMRITGGSIPSSINSVNNIEIYSDNAIHAVSAVSTRINECYCFLIVTTTGLTDGSSCFAKQGADYFQLDVSADL